MIKQDVFNEEVAQVTTITKARQHGHPLGESQGRASVSSIESVDFELRAREMEKEIRRKKEDEEYRKNVSVRAKVGRTRKKSQDEGGLTLCRVNLFPLKPFS